MNECPDAETLAAWADQGLGAEERSRFESHAAGCARCQAQLAAMTRMAAADPAIVPQSSLHLWRWLVPATAGAAAVALWVLVQPPPRAPVPPPPAETVEDRSAAAPAPPPADLSKQEVDQSRANRQLMARTRSADERREDKAVTSAPAAAAPPVPAEEAMSSLAARRFVDPIEIVSPDPAIRWRVSGSAVERSVDGGLTWQSQSIGVVSQLTAGASPSATVAWLVGRAGVIVLSTDGLAWRRVPFPETIDLTGVQATDASHATVTTADGRTFSTSDAATWVRR